jgi:hypothetical protein
VARERFMFRQPITTDPKKARRGFVILLPGTVASIPLIVWAIILQEWMVVFLGLVGEANLLAMLKDYYTVGWPGSRLDSHALFPRLSQAQYILFGLVFIVGTLGVQLALDQGRKELILGLIGAVSAVWLFRFVRAMRKEGWRGKRDGVPPARA